MMPDIIVSLLLLAGSTLILLAAVGIMRFPDALCRAHALAKASTFGICLVLGALWVALDNEISRLKIMLVIAFSLLTIPLAGHLIALLVYRYQSKRLTPPNQETP
jgi:multicomponent Na+:H+ antiporter subunit G